MSGQPRARSPSTVAAIIATQVFDLREDVDVVDLQDTTSTRVVTRGKIVTSICDGDGRRIDAFLHVHERTELHIGMPVDLLLDNDTYLRGSCVSGTIIKFVAHLPATRPGCPRVAQWLVSIALEPLGLREVAGVL